MLGIFIGIAAVVSLISMGNGLQEAITGQFGELGADKLVVQNAETGFGPPGSTAVTKLTQHDLDIVKRVPGVDFAVPRLIRTASVKYNDEIAFGYLGSVPDKVDEVKIVYDAMNIEIEKGRLLTAGDRNKIVIGSDYVNKTFGKEVKVGGKLKIQGVEFTVVGIMKRASSFIVNSVILMPTSDMHDILNISDEIDVIAVQVSNKDLVEKTAKEIEDRFRQDRKEKPGEEDFTVQTPQQSLQAVNTILNVINVVVAGIAAISLIVGGIGITNTMYTSVLERTKEIGVMKAIGAKNRDVLIIFLIESALLGLTGGVIGALLGLGMAYLITFIVGIVFPAIDFVILISLPLLFGAVLFALFVGTISGIVPALQASRLRPMEALRA